MTTQLEREVLPTLPYEILCEIAKYTNIRVAFALKLDYVFEKFLTSCTWSDVRFLTKNKGRDYYQKIYNRAINRDDVVLVSECYQQVKAKENGNLILYFVDKPYKSIKIECDKLQKLTINMPLGRQNEWISISFTNSIECLTLQRGPRKTTTQISLRKVHQSVYWKDCDDMWTIDYYDGGEYSDTD